MHNDSEFVVMHLLNIIVCICLIYLAYNNLTLCLALMPFQVLGALMLWRGVRDEVSDGNKQ